jgi:hypothetical protein
MRRNIYGDDSAGHSNAEEGTANMKIVPGLIVARFAQLAAGDLLLAPLGGDDSCVGIVAQDPIENGEKLFVSLGPVFPGRPTGGPMLIARPQMTAISFGKKYILRLPVRAKGWSASPPPEGTVGILVTDSGCYVRADAHESPGVLVAYIDMATGQILTRGSREYAVPAGIRAFAVEWEIVTDETEPRSILAHPFT